MVELVPGGSEKLLSHANKAEYADLVVSYRLHEYDEVIEAIARGLRCMIPVKVRLLQVMTVWIAVELLLLYHDRC